MIIIGEKINGSIPAVAKAIDERDAAFLQELAQKQCDAGADFIDVCASVPEKIEAETLRWMVETVQAVTDTPLAVDSPSPEILRDTLAHCDREGLVNSVSLEGNKTDILFPAIADSKWECVALLCDDSGIPKTVEKRLEIFEAIISRAKAYGIVPGRMHIDPLVEMLCASEDGIRTVTETIREIKKLYPTVHVTGAASNISFNLPARKYINQGFMILAMNAGMDSAILDPLNADMMGLIYAAEALLGEDEYCIEYINAYRDGLFGNVK